MAIANTRNEDERTYVKLHLLIICDREKLTEEGCNGAPDWILDIISNFHKKMTGF